MRKEQFTIPLVRQVARRPALAELIGRFDKWGTPFAGDRWEANATERIEMMVADGPVQYRAAYQNWFVMGYDEVREILASSKAGVTGQVESLLAVRPYNQLTREAQHFLSNWMLLLDPPEHDRMRRLVSRAFTPGQIRRLEAEVETIAGDLLDALLGGVPGGSDLVDVVPGYCDALPINMISVLLGIPPVRWQWTRDMASEVTKLLDPFRSFDPHRMNLVVGELRGYITALADQRREEPRDDLITALVQAQDDGDSLDTDELVAVVGFLMFAGFETTAGAMSNSIVALAEHPAERAKLQADPSLWPNAVEELLRYDTPVMADPRNTLEDLTLGATTIPAGENVVVLLSHANRDTRRLPDAHELRVDRDDPRPISFGHGIHHCLGAALARLELRVGLGLFIDRMGDYEIDLDGSRWKESVTLKGATRLPVRAGRI